MDEKQFKELTNRLDIIIKLLALNLPEDWSQTDKIKLLSDCGFRPKQIADILGTTANTVSVTLSRIKQDKKESGNGEPNDKQRNNESSS